MALETIGLNGAITLIENVIFNVSFAGQFWINQFAVLIASLLIITRRTSDWATLLLPVLVGWQTFGLHFNWFFYAIASAMFVINVLSIDTISNAISGIQENFGYVKSRGGIRGARRYGKIKDTKRRLDIKSEMEALEIDSEARLASKEKYEDYKMRKELKKSARKEELKKDFPILAGKSKTQEELEELKKKMGNIRDKNENMY